jgi:hypothetical protein
MFKNYILFILLFQINQLASAQIDVFDADSNQVQVPQNLDIYLVIGQSNMAGRAAIRKEDSTSIERCYLFTGDTLSAWTVANNPLNLYSSVRKKVSMQRLGPAYAFAKSMVEASPEKEIGLVVNAKGGTKIVQWLPGTDLYKAAVQQTHKALKFGKLKGVIWHQGEGDCHPVRVDLYLGRLEVLINALREEFDNPALPFVAGQIYDNETRYAFNQMLLQLPEFIENTGVVSSEGTSVFDGTHFDSESAIILGNRYAQEMIKIVKKLE